MTPLHVAIQYKHFDIVRFIIEKMKIDIRMSLAVIVEGPLTEEAQKLMESNRKMAI